MQKLKKSKILFIIGIFFLTIKPVFCQENEYDLKLLQHYTFVDSIYNPRVVIFNQIDSKNKFIQYNPVTLFFNASLFIYQKFISQHFSAGCYYQPSCSEFGRLAIKKYGLIKGIIITADRLTRCNRIAATDF